MRYFYVLLFLLLSLTISANGGDVAEYKKKLTEINLLVYSDPHKAIKEGVVWSEKANKNPDYKVSFLLAVANAYAILKDHELSFKYAFQAKEVADKNANPINSVKVLGFISSQYHRLELDDKAIEYLEEAENLTKVNPLPDSLQYLSGNILFFKGTILKDKLGNEYALQNYLKAITIFEKDKKNKTLINSLAILYGKVGEIYIETKQPDKAKSFFEKGLLKAQSVHSVKMEGNSLYGLGRVQSIENKTEESVQTFLKALEKSTQADDTALIKEIYKSLYEAYSKLGNETEKRKYHQLYLDAEKKMLLKEESTLNTLVEKIEKENQNQEKKSKNWIIFLIISLLLLVAALLFLLRKLIQKRRQLKAMSQK
ncbi:tetratricopeptide repeat protein [Flavobacterium sp.]|uniref:tetratricopeptide repeat protein n=1 Tax=Flavobacterium sp. TaxID=239 RepID=UPI0028BE900A|nr:tetratricopeptide repeat protein [Flavobacterium sp.]